MRLRLSWYAYEVQWLCLTRCCGRAARAVLMALVLAAAATAQPGPTPPKPLTAEQKEKLPERNRLYAEMQKLQADGKIDAAVAAAEKMLAVERNVFGDAHAEVADSLR